MIEPTHVPAASQVTAKTIFTVSFGVLAVAALTLFVMRTQVSLLLALGAGMVAVAMNHAVESLVGRGLRRGWAVPLVIVLVFGAAAALASVLIPPALAQARAFITAAPELWRRLQLTRSFLVLDARLDLNEQLRQSTSIASGLSALGGLLGGVAAGLTLMLLAIFMLLFGGKLVTALIAEVPDSNRRRYERVVQRVYRSVGGYVGGQLGICALNATLTTAFLAVEGMPFFLPLGILSGVCSAIPYAGPLVSGVTITLLVAIAGSPLQAMATVTYFVLYGLLEGNVLGPLIFRHTVHINPLVTMLAILFMAEFMGLPGAIIAVPAAATAQILVRELLSVRREVPAEAARPAT